MTSDGQDGWRTAFATTPTPTPTRTQPTTYCFQISYWHLQWKQVQWGKGVFKNAVTKKSQPLPFSGTRWMGTFFWFLDLDYESSTCYVKKNEKKVSHFFQGIVHGQNGSRPSTLVQPTRPCKYIFHRAREKIKVFFVFK